MPIKEKLDKIVQSLALKAIETKVPYQNWNKSWEESFRPITIPGKCCVRARFHPPQPEFPMEIVIQPQMAFGTGHHATTYLMMDRMFDLDFKGKKVLDYGCGTGILAILASKLGALSIDAIDIDPLSYENTIENLRENQISNTNCYEGTLDMLAENQYDIILANINRNVLLESGKTLFQQLLAQGTLLLSGLLKKDQAMVIESYEKQGFKQVNTYPKDGWICIELQAENNQAKH